MQELSASQHPRAMVVFGCLWLVWFWIAMLRLALHVVLPYVEAELGISHAASGLLVTAMLLAYAAVSVPAGFAARRFGARSVLMASVGCTCALSLALVAADTYGSLMVVFAGMGAALGLYFPVGLAVLSSVFPPGRFGRVIGAHDVAPSVAYVVGPALLSAVVLGRFDWRVAYEALIPIGVVLAVAMWLVLPRQSHSTSRGSMDRLRILWGRRDLLLLIVPQTLNAASCVGVLSMLTLFLVNVHGLTGQQAAIVLAGVSFGGIIGPLVGGWLSDRWSRLGTPAFYIGLSCICLAMVVVLPLGPVTYVALFLFSLTSFGYYPLNFAIIAQRVPLQLRSPVIGLFTATSILASAVSPALIGALGDAFSLRIGYLFPMVATAVGFAFLVWLIYAEKRTGGQV